VRCWRTAQSSTPWSCCRRCPMRTCSRPELALQRSSLKCCERLVLPRR
jgi:hypothetical protein